MEDKDNKNMAEEDKKNKMAEEKAKQEDKKEEEAKKIQEEKSEKGKVAEQPKEKTEEKKTETKKEKAEEKKEKPEEKSKKTEAVAFGKDLPLSTKHCIAICNFIRGKTMDKAIVMLGEVLRMKRAVPMKGELPHRRGKGMERGRYPLKASKQFVKLIKQLAANATINEIEIEKGRIECKADRAARPYKRFGNKRFKKTHVTLRLTIKEKTEEKKKKKENKPKEKKGEKKER